MIGVAIVEDEAFYVQQLKKYLHRYKSEHDESIRITVFSDGDEIVESYRADYDIIFLDVQMPFLDGMTTAEVIRKKDAEVIIIFITNMSQYAIQGYAVDALDYVLKPLSYFAFEQRVDKAISQIKQRTKKYISIPLKGGIQKLDVSQIFYLESQGHFLLYHTASGVYTSICTMKKEEERFLGMPFCRCNKGYLVNLEHVVGIQDGCVMVHGDRLQLSRLRRKEFMEALTNYLGEVSK